MSSLSKRRVNKAKRKRDQGRKLTPKEHSLLFRAWRKDLARTRGVMVVLAGAMGAAQFARIQARAIDKLRSATEQAREKAVALIRATVETAEAMAKASKFLPPMIPIEYKKRYIR